jgi:hypothetical protein
MGWISPRILNWYQMGSFGQREKKGWPFLRKGPFMDVIYTRTIGTSA